MKFGVTCIILLHYLREITNLMIVIVWANCLVGQNSYRVICLIGESVVWTDSLIGESVVWTDSLIVDCIV